MRNLPRWTRPLFALLLGLGACVGSPQPSPPNLEAESLGAEGGRAADFIDGIRVFGGPGSVDPAEGSVVVTPLDAVTRPLAEPVLPDGSFEVLLPDARTGDSIRVQVRNGGARSTPIDFVLGDDALRAPEREACFAVDLEADAGEVRVGEDASLVVAVDNDCPDARSLGASLRADGPFVIAEVPGAVGPGERAEVLLTVRSREPGTVEQTLFVEVTAPAAERRPVTLFVTGAP